MPADSPDGEKVGTPFTTASFTVPLSRAAVCPCSSGWTPRQCPAVIPRTTLWRRKREQDAAGQLEGNTKFKERKLRKCQKCGQHTLKRYGHSQHKGPQGKDIFCVLFEGKSVELWLAERRARRRRGPVIICCVTLFPVVYYNKKAFSLLLHRRFLCSIITIGSICFLITLSV